MLSCVQLFVTLWTAALQVLLSISRQEYWSGLPFSPPGDLTDDPWIEPVSLMSPVLADGFFTTEPPGKHLLKSSCLQNILVPLAL